MTNLEEKTLRILSNRAEVLERQIAATMFAPYYANREAMAHKVLALAGELVEVNGKIKLIHLLDDEK